MIYLMAMTIISLSFSHFTVSHNLRLNLRLRYRLIQLKLSMYVQIEFLLSRQNQFCFRSQAGIRSKSFILGY